MSSKTTMYEPKNILITGAAGFIASHVTTKLINKYPSYKIVALDKVDYCSTVRNLRSCISSPNFKFVRGDIATADMVNHILIEEKIDTIMHFAAQTHVDNSFGNSMEFTYNNIYGTHVLLEACRVTNYVKRFIHVSTDEVYGETDLEDNIGNHETSQLLPTNPYSATKAGAEMLVMAYHRPFNDKRYFLDDQKLKQLGWEERISWEEGLKRTIDWYQENPDWWGDVSTALNPHPRFSAINLSDEAQWSFQYGFCRLARSFTDIRGRNTSGFKFLIYGRTGWIGGLLGKLCDEDRIDWEYGRGRLQDRKSLEEDIRSVKPTHVLNAAGVTGRPNVDWCESHKVETIRTNVVGTLTLADVCKEQNLYMMNFATGCIFEYDKDHPLGSGIGFKEEDKPNFIGSFYSKTKAMVEDLLRNYANVCTLRVRMPISSDLSNPRNFITKISRYNKVVNIPNSMTVLDELLPISIEMAKRNLRGIWNFTNPGVISHNQILELYRDYIDPQFKWENFDLEEQAKVIVAPRSNNEMDASKLKKEFPELLSIRDSIIKFVFEPNKKT
ncbi:Trifunctional UDP-glucose 4,6-dehydratase [Vigna angularis]|uniref:UDP-glucose 4,6-dehydratase n=1 Tax=Phaseolus angularis TaxID=3914 RepID=A0A8T0JZ24_PHAAN|nr:Trifunctional UDP-glucose 4,6-dehydratase [Vigna angularis]